MTVPCRCADLFSGDWRRALAFWGHHRECPQYAAPLLPVSKKRKRQVALVARVESYLPPTSGAKNRGPRIRVALTQRQKKAIGGRRWWSPGVLSRAGWYTPFEPKPTKRRERRGQGKPR